MRVCDRFVSANGVRLHYREWGEAGAPAVVLLHGGSAHAHWWDLFAAAIADAYHAYALDLRGHGDSEHCRPPAYRLDDYARDLAAFIDAAVRERVLLVGHSLGGLVATLYAASAAEKIRALVIVDTSLRITAAGARYMTRLQRFPQPVYRTREEAVRRFRLLPTHTTAAAPVLAHVAACAIRQLAHGHWTLKFDREAMGHNEPVDLTACLQRLQCPILFVRGADSTLLTAEVLARLLTAVPHAEASEVPDAHHHVMLDNPSAFERIVRAFLDKAVPLEPANLRTI